MKKYFNYLSIFFLIPLVISCEKKSSAEQELEPQYPEYSEVKPYEGVVGLERVLELDPNGFLLGEGDFLHGVKHGTWISYNPTTKMVDTVETYYRGQLQGPRLTFNDKGFVTLKVNYYKGKPHGTAYIYRGRKIAEEKTYVNGKLEGKSIKYYSNGNKMEEVMYKNGKMEGIARWYNQDGSLKFEYIYENGKLIDEGPG